MNAHISATLSHAILVRDEVLAASCFVALFPGRSWLWSPIYFRYFA